MIRFTNMWRCSLFLLLVALGCPQAWAQNVVFSADASAEKIGLEDQVQVQYTIRDANDLQSVTPNGINKDFTIVAGPFQSQSSQITTANGRMVQTMSVSLTYVLVPKRTGNLTIPQATAKDGEGHTYQSNPITIQVVQGSLAQRRPQQQAYDPFSDDPFVAMIQQRNRQLQALRQQQQQAMQGQQRQQQGQPQAQQQDADIDISKDLFIRVNVDKSNVHVGEQVTASYKLYARIPMNVSISKLPSLNGFWTQDFEIPRSNIKPTEEIVNGKKYQVFLLKKSALFPQQTGTLELDPAEAEGVARIMMQTRQRNPFSSMFDDPQFQSAFGSLLMSDPFFNDDIFGTAYRDIKVKLKSTPVKIQVSALPEDGKPENFGGAVGNFTASSKVDKTEITTDDVLNYTLTITGSGNLKLIEAPALKLPNGLTSFDPQIVDTVTGRSTTISGSKIITYAISPQIAGDYEIPGTAFTYFNPQTGKYNTIETQLVKLRVKQGKNRQAGIARNNVPGDIHGIVNAPIETLHFNSKPLFHTVGYWSMYALPTFAFIALAVWRRREDELSKDVVKLKNRRANKIALKRLTTAQKLLQQNKSQQFYEEISKAIWLYLSDKLNIPLANLSRETAGDALQHKDISGSLQLEVEQIIEECEMALYMPSGGSMKMANTYQQAVAVISKLEEAFNA